MLLSKKEIKKPRKFDQLLARYGCEVRPTAFGGLAVAVQDRHRGQRPDGDIISEAMAEAVQEGLLRRV